MKLIDLHVHSNISDGTFSPAELAVYAKSKGLSVIALTDHDTTSGINSCMLKGQEIGLSVIPGIELSADYENREIHILGYYIDPTNMVLNNKISYLVAMRLERNKKMLQKLNTLGFNVTAEDLLLNNPVETIFTRAHFATILYEKGYVKSRAEAFEKYIGRDKPAYVARTRFTPNECIDAIHQAGGLAVLAHPNLYDFSSSEKEAMLRNLCMAGLDGLETFYTTHSEQQVLELLNLCIKHKLFPTGGSDFHGDNKPGIDIGVGYGELKVPYGLLNAMHQKLERLLEQGGLLW